MLALPPRSVLLLRYVGGLLPATLLISLPLLVGYLRPVAVLLPAVAREPVAICHGFLADALDLIFGRAARA